MPKQNNIILQKVIQFIKYHNAFTIGLILVFVFGGAVFASETVRDAVVGETVVQRNGIDNTALLAVNLDDFDFGLQIISVVKDQKSYYIGYTYQTLAVQNNVWQEILQGESLTVDKQALENRDLGFYVAEELSEVLDAQLVYLTKVQEQEQKKGLSFVQETTEYTALIGLLLNPKARELPGYEPVVKPPEPVELVVVYNNTTPSGQDLLEVESSTEQGSEASEPEFEQNKEEVAITIYDEQTGEAYCLKIINGIMAPMLGVCDASLQLGQPSLQLGQPSPEGGSEAGAEGEDCPGAECVIDTVIDSRPEAQTTSTEAIFEFSSNIASSTYQCNVNDLGFAPCESPKTYSGLAEGEYMFEVYAVNEIGEYDQTPVSFSWIIDELGQPSSEGATTTDPTIEESEPEPEDNTTTTDPIIDPEPEPPATTTDPIIDPEPEPPATTTDPIIEIPEIDTPSTTTDSTATTTTTE